MVELVKAEPDLAIRPIAARDWHRVFEIFSEVVTEGETYAYPDDLTSDAARALWVEGPPSETVVALRNEVILGTAKFGPNRPARGSHVATASYMVAAEARGSGVGRALCEYSISWAREHGYAAMQFNAVVSTNILCDQALSRSGFRHDRHRARSLRPRDTRARRT